MVLATILPLLADHVLSLFPAQNSGNSGDMFFSYGDLPMTFTLTISLVLELYVHFYFSEVYHTLAISSGKSALHFVTGVM